MPFCPKCGTEYVEGTKFCGGCGGSLDGSVAPVPVAVNKPGFFNRLMDTTDITGSIDASEIAGGKAMTILAYSAVGAFILFSWFGLGLLGILIAIGLLVAPILKARTSTYVALHTGQSLTLLFFVMIISILENTIASGLYNLVSTAIGVATFNVGFAFAIGLMLSILVHIIFSCIPIFVLVIGFINAAKGKAKKLPLVDKVFFEVSFKK